MPELKIDFKNLGPIRLMPLDTSSLFVPYGRPVGDYLQGLVGNQNGTRALFRSEPIDFSPALLWTESTARMLRTTGFGELEREGLIESARPPELLAPPAPPDPGVADFLAQAEPGPSAPEGNPAKIGVAIEPEPPVVAKPRFGALPLRPKMTFGAPPAAKAKAASVPVAAPAAKPAAPPIAAKPVVAPPPPPVTQKPLSPPVLKVTIPVKVAPPAQKPGPIIPPPPRSVTPLPAASAPRVAPPVPPAPVPPTPPVAAAAASKAGASVACAPEPVAKAAASPVETPAAQPASKPGPVPVPRPAPAAPAEAAAAAPAKAPIAPPAPKVSVAPAAKTPITLPGVKPPAPTPVPAARAAAPTAPPAPSETVVANPPVSPKPANVQPAAAQTTARPEAVKPAEAAKPVEAPKPAPAPRPTAYDRLPAPAVEPHLTLGESESQGFFARIPMAAKVGVAVFVLMIVLYFLFGKNGGGKGAEDAAVAVGEQGWQNEQVSDVVGSRHGRVLQIYRPSVGMTDYQLRFTGQIESKALGWFFREVDTNNYYGMKIENLAPGKMAITHFAVVEGRESGYSQRPLAADPRPGSVYQVMLDVSGPRFTAYLGGEPVDFWTDNRLKAGAVGFMNEREERGATSSVRFSFPKGAK